MSPKSLLLVVFSLPFVAKPSEGAVTVTAAEVGNDVVWSASGSIDLTALSPTGSNSSARGSIFSTIPTVVVGLEVFQAADLYAGAAVPASFGSIAARLDPSFGSDGPVGASGGTIVVPDGYVSGDPLNGSMTYQNESFQSLGLVPGTYTWTWGSGGTADSLTLTIVPEPASLFLGVLGLGFLSFRRRRTP